ncbi:MAG: N-6 DNA methylase [Candidatus Sericytochromatia bacterium]|nr:N-6 DNA methylase [Candidatus Sericytochromatia bacterium]
MISLDIEQQRLEIQSRLDGQKTALERNKMGQFATPTTLARDVLTYAKANLSPGERVRFLDPAIGTGSFYSALESVFTREPIEVATGYEIDPHYGLQSRELWASSPLRIHLEDFTKATPPERGERYNLLICNPPYVRHHHLAKDEKVRLAERASAASGVSVSGLAGLYCHFLLLSHQWMADDGLAGWLIPSEFMDVNYGRQIKAYLRDQVTLLRIHRFDPSDLQFDDALVSSAVVWFKKAKPRVDHEVEFTYGGSLNAPKTLKKVPISKLKESAKWTRIPLDEREEAEGEAGGLRLRDLFKISRGIATGGNDFFILDAHRVKELELPDECLKPILPSPRYLKMDIVDADEKGVPLVDEAGYLVSSSLPESQLREAHPSLWTYFQSGIESVSGGYLCRSRSPWYSQEVRQPAPILCTYMGRSNSAARGDKPFRFILNRSKAIATNVYLMLYPKPALARAMEADPRLIVEIWEALSAVDPSIFLGEGRVYGGGLHKMEPKELANTKVAALGNANPLLPIKLERLCGTGAPLPLFQA